MLKLFHCPGACSLASLIALEEARAAFEVVTIDLRAGEQMNADFLAINAKGKVPALLTERGVITESPAILSYVAQAYPQSHQAPLDDPFQFGVMQSFNAFIASTLQPATGPLGRPERYSDDPQTYEPMRHKALANTLRHFELIEDQLLAGPWVLGTAHSVADSYLFTFSELIGRLNFNAERFPRILEHRARVADRPAVKRAQARVFS